MKFSIRNLLVGLVLIIVLAVVFLRGDQLAELAETMQRGSTIPLVAAILTQLCKYVSQSFAYSSCFRAVGEHMAPRTTLPLVFGTFFMNTIAPSLNLAGTTLVVDDARRRGISPGKATSAALLMQITIDGKPLDFKRHVYLMLNKPQGYVSATEDRDHQTVLELVPEAYRGRDLFPAGRLDRDTTGLMIITDDGALAHNILAPKKHVPKLYRVELDIPVTEEMRERFLVGVVLNDGVCKAADLTKIDTRIALVTLREGRYHQIKRMFGCCGAAVVALKRLGMGKLYLPEDLAEGECRELTAEELALLQAR